jgi:hypothetical protein
MRRLLVTGMGQRIEGTIFLDVFLEGEKDAAHTV